MADYSDAATASMRATLAREVGVSVSAVSLSLAAGSVLVTSEIHLATEARRNRGGTQPRRRYARVARSAATTPLPPTYSHPTSRHPKIRIAETRKNVFLSFLFVVDL